MDCIDQLLHLRQGCLSIEEYVYQFCELSYEVPLYDELLFTDLFQFGLNEPVKSCLPAGGFNGSLKDCIDYALLCAGSSFTVGVAESAPEPAPSQELAESAPEPAPSQELAESAPEPAPSQELAESAPEAAPSQELAESAPEAAPCQELAESAPEAAPCQELAESAPEAEASAGSVQLTDASADPVQLTFLRAASVQFRSTRAPPSACSSPAPQRISAFRAPPRVGPVQLIFVSTGPVQLIFFSAGPVHLTVVSADSVQFGASRAFPRPSTSRMSLDVRASRVPPWGSGAPQGLSGGELPAIAHWGPEPAMAHGVPWFILAAWGPGSTMAT